MGAEPSAKHTLRVAFDAMGGYRAPDAAVQAAAEASLHGGFTSVLVGDAARIDPLLLRLAHNPERLNIEHTTGAVPMDAPPSRALASHPDASITRCAELLAAGRVDAVVTAGNPGVAVLAMKRHVPMLQGVQRAAIAAVVPTQRRRGEKKDPFSLVLDVGATDHASARELVSFAVMGAAYARCIGQNPCPRVALLSNSAESSVGPSEVVQAARELAALSDGRHFTFIGTIEGHQLPAGDADVVVCEGYVGHVVVRLLEGISETAIDIARAAYDKKLKWRLGLSMLSRGLEQLRKLTDWEQYGGAPLLGFTAPVLVAHGNSDKQALLNAAKLAVKAAKEGVAGKIEANLR